MLHREKGSSGAPILSLAIIFALICAFYTNLSDARTSARINAGASKDYTDPAGNLWMSDRNFSGGKTGSINTSLFNSTQVQLHANYRVANNRRVGLKYAIDTMDAGNYTCALYFTESNPAAAAASRRVFHVSINGQRVATSFDIYKQSGDLYLPLVKTFACTPDAKGIITISFDYFIGDPIVSALEVTQANTPDPEPSTPTPPPPPPSSGGEGEIDVGVSPLPGAPPTYVRPPAGNPNPTNLPVERALYRINCGSTVDYTDTRGKKWAKDQYYVDPTMVDRFDNIPWAPLEPHPYGVDGCYDETIYLTERFHPDGFSYLFPNVPNGKWLVRVHFAELYTGNFILYDPLNPNQGLKGTNARVFSVRANGVTKLPRVDVFQSIGPYSAIVREFYVDINGENQIKLDFVKIIESPMVFAIEIVHAADVVPAQLLPTGRRQGIASLYMDYGDYYQNPIMTMPEGGKFTKPVSYVEIADYYNNPNNYPFAGWRSTPYSFQFAMKAYTYLRVPKAGDYKITIESNDGSIMWVWKDTQGTGTPVEINCDGNHVATQVAAVVNFPAAGFYPVLLYYFNGNINCALRIYWMTPDDDWSTYIPYRNAGRVIAPEFWSYDPAVITPVVTAVNPNHGPVGGGNVITVTGAGFSDRKNTKCRFNHPGKGSTYSTATYDITGSNVSCTVPEMLGGMGSVQVVIFSTAGAVLKESNNFNYFFDA